MSKRIFLLVMICFTFAACSPVRATNEPITKPTETTIVMPTATIEATPELSFSPYLFEDTEGKFGFQYPSDWTVIPEQLIGARGSQTVFLSPGSTLETLADGGSRIVLLKYAWDPKNDLSAWTTQRKLAWDASGFVIVNESTRELEDGRAVVDLRMKAPDGTDMLFSLTTLGDRYLEINAQGNLELCREILETVKSNN
jgi:hypothetical protein